MHAYRLVEKVELIKIQCNNLVFGVPRLQLQRNNPLFEFLKNPARFTGCRLVEHLLGQLLGQRGTTPLGTETGQGPPQGAKVYTGVVVKTLVFGGHQGLYQMRGELIVFGMDAVFFKKGSQLLAVGVHQLGGQKTLGVGDFFGGRQGAKSPNPGQKQAQEDEGRYGKYRNPKDSYFAAKIARRSGFICGRHWQVQWRDPRSARPARGFRALRVEI